MKTAIIPVVRDGDRLLAGDVEVEVQPRNLLGGGFRLTEATARALSLDRASRYRLRICRVCDDPFVCYSTRLFCSDECSAANRRAWLARHRPSEPPQLSKFAKRMMALANAKCATCGEPFTPKRLAAKFCSGRCRQEHHRRRVPPLIQALGPSFRLD